MRTEDFEVFEGIDEEKKERGPGVLGAYFESLRVHTIDPASKTQGDLILQVRQHVLDCKAKARKRLACAQALVADPAALAKPTRKRAKAEKLLRDWGVPAEMSDADLVKHVGSLVVDLPGPMLLAFVGKDAKLDFDRLVVQNLRLVVSIARDYAWSKMPFSDIIQTGNLGLIRGIALNEPERGHRLSTYCTWWIKSVIQRAVLDTVKTVRMPVHLADAKARIKRIRTRLHGRLGRPPMSCEIADEIIVERKAKKGKSDAKGGGRAARSREEVIKEVERADKVQDVRCISLNQPTLKGEGVELIELLSSDVEDGLATDDALIRDEGMARLRSAIEKLSPRERKVIALRFGFADAKEDGLTLKEVGVEFRLSRERVRQLEVQALGKLRKALSRLGRA